ncbi:glycoside hydrolase family 13 protein [Brachybacterium alimentarium]|uniref:alpha-amylase family glycosyl hydrolase n=1 Tax=Brachybacterium alimentarium TaxID=47845 RepID=UPI000DF43BAC|nr:alpha-amylase family glycosyl hydrolase [Brachybacterium alimentarium]RCS75759.1 glycoside hydrolase family 13 protein [Brachybacterium alimentarium]
MNRVPAPSAEPPSTSFDALGVDATGVPLIEQPHHDSGPCFVAGDAPALDARSTLRVWVPIAYPASALALRTVSDGEIRTSELHVAAQDSTGTWWEAELSLTNPVMPYRFCVLAPQGSVSPSGAAVPSYAWLTAAGLVPWDVSDATDFRLLAHEPAPDWVDDAIVYQIFPDRFSRSTRMPLDADGRPAPADLPCWAVPMAWEDEPAMHGELTGRQFFGGDLDGILERLDHIALLGANTLYLTPVFPAGSVHRYDASAFDHVDPLLGGDDALVRLSTALHERGMRLLLDLTTHHTGDTHEWFRAAQADPESIEAGFYLFEEHPHQYASWLDVPTLPKLDQRNAELRSRLTRGAGSVVGRYLSAPFAADGWRIDVANMTGRHGTVDLTHEVAREIRATMREVADSRGQSRAHSAWLVAEHGHDATADLAGDGWHGTMNYAGFTRPLWAWLADPESDLSWLGLPMTLPRLPGTSIWRTLRDYNAQMPWPSRAHSQNQLSSHDTPRTRTVVGSRERQLAAVAALATLPGVPTVFAGDELGAQGENGEHSRAPMPWEAIDRGDGERIDLGILEATRLLLGLRRELVALRRGGLRWLHAGTDALVYARTHPDGDVLVHLARGAHDEIVIGTDSLPGAPCATVHTEVGGANARHDRGVLRLVSSDAGASIIRLDSGA